MNVRFCQDLSDLKFAEFVFKPAADLITLIACDFVCVSVGFFLVIIILKFFG